MDLTKLEDFLQKYQIDGDMKQDLFTALSIDEVDAPTLLKDVEEAEQEATVVNDSALTFGFENLDLSGVIDASETWVLGDDDSAFWEKKNAEPSPPTLPQLGRYDDLGILGKGGMGEVRQIRDKELNRKLAMKIIHPDLLKKDSAIARFIEEGQVGAQLQHPNIVPVHELGQLDDGRFYFTMKEIKGRAFGEAIDEVHEAVEHDRWQITHSGLSFRKLIDAFHQVCQAISYAHSKGVLHRDLKPENIMLGEYGEVLVVDWGIAKVLGRRDYVLELEEVERVHTDRSDTFMTRMGQIAGTPAYMPPEQALGKIDELDSRSDIYALGAILYEILTGRAPYVGIDGREILDRVLQGPPESIRTVSKSIYADSFSFEYVEDVRRWENIQYSGPPLPDELVEACEKAMQRDKEARHASAEEFAQIISDWLEGAKKREQALKIVDEALELEQTRREMRKKAKALQEKSAEGLKKTNPWESEDTKGAWWAMEAEAQKLNQEADLLRIVQEQKLQAALTHKADLEEAHLELATRYLQEHQKAEYSRNMDIVKQTEIKLREHVDALPTENQEKTRLLSYLKGTGAITLTCDLEGVEILLEAFVPHHKRLIPRPIASLSQRDLREYPLEMGSYRIRLRKNGCPEVFYPISIGRSEHWTCRDPFGTIKPIHIPKPEEVGENECFVPASWFFGGGDPHVSHSLSRKRVWVDDIIVRKYPVTNREYLLFLDDLVQRGQEDEALRYVPRERAGHADDLGAMIYGRKPDGRFELVPDADGDLWGVDWPVIMVDWYSAMAYAKWEAERTGKPYRLLHEIEWEKAAKGVDGRFYPWGDDFDPSYGCMHKSYQGRSLPHEVFSFPIDSSPYGVRGMAGNNRDWCLNRPLVDWRNMTEIHTADEDTERLIYRLAYWDEKEKDLLREFKDVAQHLPRIVRGGFFSGGEELMRCSFRAGFRVGVRSGDVGFRIGYSPLNRID